MLLAGVMMVGTIGSLGTVPASATGETNTFTLTVPADTNITKSGWNDIGSVGVSNVSIAAGKKIEVTIADGATGRNLVNTASSGKKVGYEIKKGNATTNEAFGDKLEFTANGTQAIGAVVNATQFAAAEAGTYEDTINFTATLTEGISAENFPLTGTGASGKVLKASELLTAENKNFEYDGTTYTAYNGFISQTAGASWQEAQDFVAELNKVDLGSRTGGWILLTNKDMAFEWWQSTRSSDLDKHSTSGVYYGQSSIDGVNSVWTSASNPVGGYAWRCGTARTNAENGIAASSIKSAAWGQVDKSMSSPSVGFVVLRVSASSPN